MQKENDLKSQWTEQINKFLKVEKVSFLPETRLPIDWRILGQAPHGETHPPVAEKRLAIHELVIKV